MGKRSTSMAVFFFGCFGPSSTKKLSNGQSLDHRNDGVVDDHMSASEVSVHDKVCRCDVEDQSYCSESSSSSSTCSGALKRFSWNETEKMTSSFSEVIGLGGYSTVYMAKLTGSAMGAVKVYNFSERLNQVFRSELEVNSQLSHPNVVKLLGYCDERDEGVLVFEYIPHGTLQEKLHNKTKSQAVLPWKTRMAIAYQLVEALDYLHEQHSPHIIHGDIKASNILLVLDDAQTYCKLCDFGFAKTGFSSSIKPNSSSSSSSRLAMMGSPGYIDPHYLMTGIASKKSDVYSFGVILLELITGVEAFPPERQQLLTSMVRKSDGTFDMEKVMRMVDPRVKGGAHMEEARAMACIASKCLEQLPSLRPSPLEICQAMREKISSISFLCDSKKDLHGAWNSRMEFAGSSPIERKVEKMVTLFTMLWRDVLNFVARRSICKVRKIRINRKLHPFLPLDNLKCRLHHKPNHHKDEANNQNLNRTESQNNTNESGWRNTHQNSPNRPNRNLVRSRCVWILNPQLHKGNELKDHPKTIQEILSSHNLIKAQPRKKDDTRSRKQDPNERSSIPRSLTKELRQHSSFSHAQKLERVAAHLCNKHSHVRHRRRPLDPPAQPGPTNDFGNVGKIPITPIQLVQWHCADSGQ
ncbi:hypothetical protein V2J09_014760 [Rumex salicifolius]